MPVRAGAAQRTAEPRDVHSGDALTLTLPNLSHKDFLDVPAAIHGSMLVISDTIQDESSNELINPEIFRNNHHKIIYSFAFILPAIFPDTLYLLVPV